MSKAKHTPRPWNYTGFDDHCQVGRKYHEIVDADGYEVVNDKGILEESHARLIAAAPEMVEWITAFAQRTNQDFKVLGQVGIRGYRDSARALLARIEGSKS